MKKEKKLSPAMVIIIIALILVAAFPVFAVIAGLITIFGGFGVAMWAVTECCIAPISALIILL